MAEHLTREGRRRGALIGTVLGVAAITGLTACVPEPLGGSFIIENRSDQPIYESTHRIPPHGRSITGGRGCTTRPWVLYTKQGKPFVRVDRLCSGEVWIVYGRNDSVVRSATEPAGPREKATGSTDQRTPSSSSAR